MTLLAKLSVGIACFSVAFVLASLVEYWLHRLMHVSPRIGERHRDHHRRNEGQGVLWEFRDYVKGSLVVMCLMFFYSWEAGIGWFLGGLFYAAFSAYAHQLQHENPTKCFWMKMPVSLCASQIWNVASQLWFGGGLVGSGFWHLQAGRMAGRRGTESTATRLFGTPVAVGVP